MQKLLGNLYFKSNYIETIRFETAHMYLNIHFLPLNIV